MHLCTRITIVREDVCDEMSREMMPACGAETGSMGRRRAVERRCSCRRGGCVRTLDKAHNKAKSRNRDKWMYNDCHMCEHMDVMRARVYACACVCIHAHVCMCVCVYVLCVSFK